MMTSITIKRLRWISILGTLFFSMVVSSLIWITPVLIYDLVKQPGWTDATARPAYELIYIIAAIFGAITGFFITCILILGSIVLVKYSPWFY